MIKEHPLRGAHKFKLGTFSTNADGGLAITTVEERWRVDLVLAVMVLLSVGALFAPRGRGWCLGLLLSVVPVGGGLMLFGGVFGLPHVDSSDWGGLMLNIVITFISVALSLPLGVALAFGLGGKDWAADRIETWWPRTRTPVAPPPVPPVPPAAQGPDDRLS